MEQSRQLIKFMRTLVNFKLILKHVADMEQTDDVYIKLGSNIPVGEHATLTGADWFSKFNQIVINLHNTNDDTVRCWMGHYTPPT